MAIKPSTHFPPSRVNAGSTEYPQGSAKDETSSGANDGTPAMQASVWNDIWGFLQKLLSVAGITPSGSADTVLASDYYDALTSNAVKASLGSVDAGDVPGDRTVTNTGKGVTYSRSAVGIFGTTNVRTDVIPILSVPTFAETVANARVWRAAGLSLIVPLMPAQLEIISATLVFDYEYDPALAPGETYAVTCPASISHSATPAATFDITAITVLSNIDPDHANASNHRLYLTYQADW